MGFITAALEIKEVLKFAKKLKEAANQFVNWVSDKVAVKSMEEIILSEITRAIDDVGIKTRTGHLKSSFKFVGVKKTKSGAIYQVISTARYMSYLNDGTAPSYGRYVPAIGKRLIDSNRLNIGMHPGNRPYKFMEKAAERVKGRAMDVMKKQIFDYLKKWLSS